jgi:hypothetical protein
MRRGVSLAFVLIIACLLLIMSCSNSKTPTGAAVKNTSSLIQHPKVSYKLFQQADFSVKYPNWSLSKNSGKERQLTAKADVCSIAVNKYNALPDSLFDFLKTKVSETGGYELKKSEADSYYLEYESPYKDYAILNQLKLGYCNYQAYSVTVMCLSSYYDDYYSWIAETVLDSMKCAKEYSTSIPEIDNNPITADTVPTNVGEKYGIDDKDVVYLVNDNQFLTGILSQFTKVNLLVEMQEYSLEIRLRANITDGRITHVDKGQFSDAEVTIMLPLMDALNIFTNAQKINKQNFNDFFANAQTDPVETKEEVLSRI